MLPWEPLFRNSQPALMTGLLRQTGFRLAGAARRIPTFAQLKIMWKPDILLKCLHQDYVLPPHNASTTVRLEVLIWRYWNSGGSWNEPWKVSESSNPGRSGFPEINKRKEPFRTSAGGRYQFWRALLKGGKMINNTFSPGNNYLRGEFISFCPCRWCNNNGKLCSNRGFPVNKVWNKVYLR